MMDARTNEILKRFSESWDQAEVDYDNLINNHSGWDRLRPLRKYIDELRKGGEDQYFRIGYSVARLMISRSVNFGLRKDQKYIMIEAVSVDQFDVIFRDGEKVYREYTINSLDDIRLVKLLETLKSTLVD